MEKLWNTLSLAVGIIGGTIIKLLGGGDAILAALALLIVFDYVSGLIKAVMSKNLSSAVGFRGIAKKVLIFVMVAVATVLQSVTIPELPLREIVIMFYMANEGLSILENVAEFLPVPEKVREVLEQLRDRK